ncbi:hypothetical protein HK101_010636 [Irineochytrium annulatum]|nr:hypothetical protein HK101_010636 [Irineochytrium annulatum]
MIAPVIAAVSLLAASVSAQNLVAGTGPTSSVNYPADCMAPCSAFGNAAYTACHITNPAPTAADYSTLASCLCTAILQDATTTQCGACIAASATDATMASTATFNNFLAACTADGPATGSGKALTFLGGVLNVASLTNNGTTTAVAGAPTLAPGASGTAAAVAAASTGSVAVVTGQVTTKSGAAGLGASSLTAVAVMVAAACLF